MKQGIIFDMDGTLWDSAENVANSWNLAIEEYGKKKGMKPEEMLSAYSTENGTTPKNNEKTGEAKRRLTTGDIHSVMGKTMDVIADILFAKLDKEARMELLQLCCGMENDYLRKHGGVLYPDLENTLAKLKERYPLYIVSNCQKGYIEAFLDYYQLWNYFEDIECYGNNLLEKGDNIRLLAERNQLEDAVYVGDIQGDYDASRKAGVKFVHAAYGFGTIDTEVPRIENFAQLADLKLFGLTKLDEILAQINREHVYIQTHNFPDPDALASAFGLQQLLKYRGIEADICFKGKIERYNTDKMRELMGIKLLDVEDLSAILTDEDEVILVDAQKGNSNIIDITGDEIICIDHHPLNDKFHYRFADIRPEIGACASIIASYFFENEIPMDETTATALTFGIRMDTMNLSRGVSKLDVEMIYRMFDLCDKEMIHMLQNSNLYFEDLMAYSRAISSIQVYGNVSFADTGKNCPAALIASVSDFMLALVTVSFSVVYSRNDEGIKLSVRSEKKVLDAGKIVNKALEGVGSGGGHAAMAGGFVPFTGSDREAQLLVESIKERFCAVIGEDCGDAKELSKNK